MLFLIFAIICSASIALIFKFSEDRNSNRYSITSVNYLMAFSMSFFTGIKLENTSLILNISLLGICGGIFFFLSFLFYQICIKKSGASLSGAFGKMGILLPMILSILLWHEIPGAVQIAGISVALLSVAIVYIPTKNVNRDKNISKFHFHLLLLFFFGGMAEFFGKIFQNYFPMEYKSTFLFFLFLTAFIISTAFALLKRRSQKTLKSDFLIGIAVGIPNYFSSYFLILSLDTLKSSVVFPIYSAGSILIINLGSYLIFRERLNFKEKTAILMAASAMVLINL